MSFFGISVIAKTGANAGQYARAIRQQIQAMDPNLAVSGGVSLNLAAPSGQRSKTAKKKP